MRYDKFIVNLNLFVKISYMTNNKFHAKGLIKKFNHDRCILDSQGS